MRIPGLFRSAAPHEFAAERPTTLEAPGQPAHAWYRLQFPVPAHWSDGRRVELNFTGLLYRVLLNGTEVAPQEGFHLPLRVDVTRHITPGQKNCLEVSVAACERGDRIGREGLYAGIWGDGCLFEFDARSGIARDYIRGAGVQGGRQDHGRLSQVIPAEAQDYAGQVWFWLDRGLPRGNLRLGGEAVGTGFLDAQLRGDGWELVCNNLTEGNILTGTGEGVVKTVDIPPDRYPEATTVTLARYHGPIEVFSTTVTPLWEAAPQP